MVQQASPTGFVLKNTIIFAAADAAFKHHDIHLVDLAHKASRTAWSYFPSVKLPFFANAEEITVTHEATHTEHKPKKKLFRSEGETVVKDSEVETRDTATKDTKTHSTTTDETVVKHSAKKDETAHVHTVHTDEVHSTPQGKETAHTLEKVEDLTQKTKDGTNVIHTVHTDEVHSTPQGKETVHTFEKVEDLTQKTKDGTNVIHTESSQTVIHTPETPVAAKTAAQEPVVKPLFSAAAEPEAAPAPTPEPAQPKVVEPGRFGYATQKASDAFYWSKDKTGAAVSKTWENRSPVLFDAAFGASCWPLSSCKEEVS